MRLEEKHLEFEAEPQSLFCRCYVQHRITKTAKLIDV